MIYFQLILEFVKISLFSFGGGYGTLPFIYYISVKYSWFTAKEIMHMIAISAVTPGAFGVNMATYTGFKTLGITGSVLATLALVIPSVILSICVYKLLKKYRDSDLVQDTLETLRAISSGLLFVVVLQMLNQEIFHFNLNTFTFDFDFNALLFLILSLLIYFLVKKNIPITMLITLIFAGIIKYLAVL